jgi:formylglycine-generating enzyme required for sulfatase activity
MNTLFTLKKTFLACTLTIFLLSSSTLFGNNLVVSAGSRVLPYTSNNVTFTITWDNSWNVSGLPGNHDAAWIFIKFRECGASGQWNHALLSTTMANHTLASSLSFAKPIVTTDKWGNAGAFNNGAMIRRSSIGLGTTTGTVTLNIVGSATGVVFDPLLEYDIAVVGIEMVQVRQGDNTVGDGYNSNFHFAAMPIAGLLPMTFSSEATTQIVTYIGNYSTNVPALFPKGYDEFYCMKYEITQGQYTNFLNNIGVLGTQRYYVPGYSYMYNITYASGVYTTTGNTAGDVTDRTMTYFSPQDLLTYLDWAALRPMTEFEFERACRGNDPAFSGSYAWGTAPIVEAINISGATSGVEVCTNVGANCNYYGTTPNFIPAGGALFTGSNVGYCPLAAGIFARDATVTREATGATYWGIMEMSGNMWEFAIQPDLTDGNPGTSSPYTGLWGNGQISATGLYDVTNWPTTTRFAFRGGSHQTNVGVNSALQVSSRTGINQTNYTNRSYDWGGRGVR